MIFFFKTSPRAHICLKWDKGLCLPISSTTCTCTYFVVNACIKRAAPSGSKKQQPTATVHVKRKKRQSEPEKCWSTSQIIGFKRRSTALYWWARHKCTSREPAWAPFSQVFLEKMLHYKKQMSKIDELKNLQPIKLRCCWAKRKIIYFLMQYSRAHRNLSKNMKVNWQEVLLKKATMTGVRSDYAVWPQV